MVGAVTLERNHSEKKCVVMKQGWKLHAELKMDGVGGLLEMPPFSSYLI